MTREERIRYLKGLLKCEICEEESTKICKSCDNRRIGSSAKCYDALKEVIKALEQKPEPEPRWIPISEGMPKDTNYYLIQYSRKYCPDEMAVAFYDVEEKESDPNYEWEFEPQCGEYKEVIAWKPLPKPYKAESEEE